jgi:hypothetical protein
MAKRRKLRLSRERSWQRLEDFKRVREKDRLLYLPPLKWGEGPGYSNGSISYPQFSAFWSRHYKNKSWSESTKKQRKSAAWKAYKLKWGR